LGSAIGAAVACGPVVGTDETTAAAESTGNPASTSTGQGDETHAQTTDAGTTDTGTTDAGTTDADTTAFASTGLEDTTTGESCGASGVDDCCCFAQNGFDVDVLCSSTPLCENELIVDCGGFPGAGYFCPLGGGSIPEPSDLDCVLEVLANPSVGHFTVHEVEGEGGRDYTIYTTDTDEAFLLTNWYLDFSGAYDESSRLMLPPPATFEACQQLPEPIERYDCMRSGLTNAVEQCLPL